MSSQSRAWREAGPPGAILGLLLALGLAAWGVTWADPVFGLGLGVVILAGATVAYCGYQFWCCVGSVLTVLFIIYAHRQNIRELLQ